MDPTLARHVAGTISRYEPNPERPAAYMAREPKTMRDPGTAQWDMEISTADFTQLKLGFMAQEMEDKWSGRGGRHWSGREGRHLDTHHQELVEHPNLCAALQAPAVPGSNFSPGRRH
ncbi:hypothetical protein MCOR25_001973 [Pyricularia grisea]|nr:hypothetical protein MCOR25_001973 [Pyricularia grisea]